MNQLLSTRFNNDTWNENSKYRLERKILCIYGSPQEISPKIDYETIVFVIEMNNSINQIEGIGLIKNKPDVEKYYKIYSNANFNRYIYKSNYHISREILKEYNLILVDVLDHILFKGKTHLKRGSGFTTIPEKLIKSEFCDGMDIKQEIKNIFICHFRSNLVNNINNDFEFVNNEKTID